MSQNCRLLQSWLAFWGLIAFQSSGLCILTYILNSYSLSHVCLVVSCWKRADLLALVCDVYLWRYNFPIGILGQVWCLIAWIPDLCPLSYSDGAASHSVLRRSRWTYFSHAYSQPACSGPQQRAYQGYLQVTELWDDFWSLPLPHWSSIKHLCIIA